MITLAINVDLGSLGDDELFSVVQSIKSELEARRDEARVYESTGQAALDSVHAERVDNLEEYLKALRNV